VEKPNLMKAVILAGGQDMRKCPLEMVRPRPLFPLPAEVLLQECLRKLRTVGVDEAILCANGKTHILEKHFEHAATEQVSLGFHDEKLPRGTGGCLRDIADALAEGTFLVLESGVFIDGDLTDLVERHRRSGSALTLGAVPAEQWFAGDGDIADGPLAPLGVYVAEPEILDHIPEHSYCDLKEQLIPKLRRCFLDVLVAPFSGRHRRISDAASYETFIDELLTGTFGDGLFTGLTQAAPHLWLGENAYVDPSAELIGPIVVGPNAFIGSRAVVTGPTLIGENVQIHDQAVVTGSVLWPNATIGLGANVEHSIVTDGFHVSVFSRLSHCVAIDRSLKLGDVHGLKHGGYAIGLPDRARCSGKAAAAVRKLLKSLMACRG